MITTLELSWQYKSPEELNSLIYGQALYQLANFSKQLVCLNTPSSPSCAIVFTTDLIVRETSALLEV